MIDLLLFLIIGILVVLIVFILYYSGVERNNLILSAKQDRDKLVNALVAKHPAELRDLTLADKVAPIVPGEQQPPDLVPESQLGQEEWESAIQQQQLENQQEPVT